MTFCLKKTPNMCCAHMLLPRYCEDLHNERYMCNTAAHSLKKVTYYPRQKPLKNDSPLFNHKQQILYVYVEGFCLFFCVCFNKFQTTLGVILNTLTRLTSSVVGLCVLLCVHVCVFFLSITIKVRG